MNKLDTIKEELKNKTLTREDISMILSAVGKPGKSLKSKRETVATLGGVNFQGIPLEQSLKDYKEY